MKQRVILFVLVALFIQCKVESQSYGTSIKGEGDVIKKEVKLDAFTGVGLSFAGDVVLTQGSPQKVVIEGQENIIDNIRKVVKNGVWSIANEKNVRDAKPVTVYITIPTLTEASVAGSGTIHSTSKFTALNDLEVNISGSGSIALSVEAKSMDSNVSGSGKITLDGMTQSHDIAISGSGNVFAQKLRSSECEVSIAGSGDAEVFVNGELKTSISGSGDVRYTGDASVTSKVSGSGGVSKI